MVPSSTCYITQNERTDLCAELLTRQIDYNGNNMGDKKQREHVIFAVTHGFVIIERLKHPVKRWILRKDMKK